MYLCKLDVKKQSNLLQHTPHHLNCRGIACIHTKG